MGTVKAGVYARISSDSNDTRRGVTRQVEDCLTLCQAKGWEPVIYTENNSSATQGTRPVYRQLLADIESGALQAVAVYHLDRLHRRPIELEEFINLADAKHIALATVSGDVNLATDNGRLIARITGAVARAEMARKSARMKRANQQAAERGVMRGKTKAFGYTPDNHLDPQKAPALRRAYTDVQTGASLRAVAARWNEAGFTTQTGKPWERSAVRKVLLNPRNAGLRQHNGEIVGEATWPAIVDRDTYAAVVALLNNPARKIVKTPGRKYLMSGIALCGKCAHPVGSTTPSRQRGPRYHCKHCFGVTRKIDDVDNFVLSIVAERLSRPDARGLLQQHDNPDLAGLTERANTLHVLAQGLIDDVVDGKITRAQLHTANERIDKELAAIDAKLIDASKSRVFDGVIAADPTVVRARLDALDLDRRRAVIDALLTATVMPGQTRGRFRTDLVLIAWK